MSIDRIAELLDSANQTVTKASLEDGDRAAKLTADARKLRREADEVAAKDQPEIAHPNQGLGVVVGVTAGGKVRVSFGGVPFAHEYHLEDVARWAL